MHTVVDSLFIVASLFVRVLCLSIFCNTILSVLSRIYNYFAAEEETELNLFNCVLAVICLLVICDPPRGAVGWYVVSGSGIS